MNINRLILLFLIVFQRNNSVSLVYSLKIRRLFSLNAAIAKTDKSKLVFSAVPIVHNRKRHIIDENFGINTFEKNRIGGSIFNLRYVSKKFWWLEASTGVEKETVKHCGSLNFKNCRTGLDDIIISGGYNFIVNPNAQFVLYGLTGFPSTRKVTPQEINNTLVGTRFFSLGFGAEFSYSFINEVKKSLIGIAQFRFIHFFDRSWVPILSKDTIIQPGNTTDLLFTLQYRKMKNIFEVGYNPTFFTNQAIILNNKKIESNNIGRESMYFTYSRLFKKFPGLELPGLIGAGASYAKSDTFDTRINAWWLNFSILF